MSPNYGRLYETARGRVLQLLWDTQWHTWREISTAGGVRYGARLLELKRQGYTIETEGKKKNGLHYRLVSHTRGEPQVKRVKVLLNETDVLKLIEHGWLTAIARAALNDALCSYRHNKEKL